MVAIVEVGLDVEVLEIEVLDVEVLDVEVLAGIGVAALGAALLVTVVPAPAGSDAAHADTCRRTSSSAARRPARRLTRV